MIFLDVHCVIFLSKIPFISTEEFQKRRNTEKGKGSPRQSYDAGSREICHSSRSRGAITMAGGYLACFDQFQVKYKINAD